MCNAIIFIISLRGQVKNYPHIRYKIPLVLSDNLHLMRAYSWYDCGHLISLVFIFFIFLQPLQCNHDRIASSVHEGETKNCDLKLLRTLESQYDTHHHKEVPN